VFFSVILTLDHEDTINICVGGNVGENEMNAFVTEITNNPEIMHRSDIIIVSICVFGGAFESCPAKVRRRRFHNMMPWAEDRPPFRMSTDGINDTYDDVFVYTGEVGNAVPQDLIRVRVEPSVTFIPAIAFTDARSWPRWSCVKAS
jgi:hypothetical protein